MSFISRTAAGTYRAFWRDPAGRQRSKNFDTKRQAKLFLTEVQSQMTKGHYADPHSGRILFGDHARQWMSTWNAETTTLARDRSIMNSHVLPRWSATPLAKIDHLAVQAWVTELGTRRSSATVAEAYVSPTESSARRCAIGPYPPIPQKVSACPSAANRTPPTGLSAENNSLLNFSRPHRIVTARSSPPQPELDSGGRSRRTVP
jgi:hypothetical protein